MTAESPVIVKQLLAGRDHALSHPVAGQMMNFAYLVGCAKTQDCLLVDPTWDPEGLVEIAESQGFKVVGCIATHGHPDHVGGAMMGFEVPGIREIADRGPIHAHPAELETLCEGTGLAADAFQLHEDGETIELGEQQLDVLLCPGHTPGHIVVVGGGSAITGDVLFVGACGRIDLPGSDPRAMFDSLQRLAKLPGETMVYPGHHYGGAMTSTIENERKTNPYLQISTVEEWTRMMGGSPW